MKSNQHSKNTDCNHDCLNIKLTIATVAIFTECIVNTIKTRTIVATSRINTVMLTSSIRTGTFVDIYIYIYIMQNILYNYAQYRSVFLTQTSFEIHHTI